jgi:hypothetical protein
LSGVATTGIKEVTPGAFKADSPAVTHTVDHQNCAYSAVIFFSGGMSCSSYYRSSSQNHLAAIDHPGGISFCPPASTNFIPEKCDPFPAYSNTEMIPRRDPVYN